MNESNVGFLERLHVYVSSDPTVAVAGTPLPLRSLRPLGHSYQDMVVAAASALRAERTDITRRTPARRLFVKLAEHLAYAHTHILADLCQCSPRAIQLIYRQAAPPGLPAALACLADARLRIPFELRLKRSSPMDARRRVA